MSAPKLTLKPGREKSLLRRHPWIFSGAVERLEGDPQPGDTVEVYAADGRWLARAAYSPRSQIRARVWTFVEDESVTPDFFRSRLARALVARQSSVFSLQSSANHQPSAARLVNAESDFLPGLIVDRYAGWLVCQFLSAGAEKWKREIVAALGELVPNAGIYERSDVDVRAKEGLPPVTGVLSGAPPPELVEIEEHGCRFLVDVQRGHKTGFYLDQRDNRALLAGYASGREVLNAFAYTGGFGVLALKGGAAHVTNLDSSAAALELAQRNFELNGFDETRTTYHIGDAFAVLRQYRDAGRQFDLIVLDPPKFAESKGQVERAARGYKDINLLAFKLLRPGGLLFSFSCSGVIDPTLFQKIVADAAVDAGREAQILRRLTQSADHPVGLSFPEGEYLKGLVCFVE
ncbi:MAG: class I SAM-dependent methyltransferase [Anaerolineales bacterium]|nr:class I SAM-dependent methyltransferase [Anaerolineales bacterium]